MQGAPLKPIWFILASGPSMCREDAEAVRGLGNIVVINNTVELAPWADMLYACDGRWWRHYKRHPSVAGFTGKKLCLKTDEKAPADVEPQEWEPGAGLGLDKIRPGGNSGRQAINYAFLQGARTIVLLGYDMQSDGKRMHWHEDHSKRLGNFNRGVASIACREFVQVAYNLRQQNVRVINCTRQTALTAFERMPLQELLNLISAEAA